METSSGHSEVADGGGTQTFEHSRDHGETQPEECRTVESATGEPVFACQRADSRQCSASSQVELPRRCSRVSDGDVPNLVHTLPVPPETYTASLKEDERVISSTLRPRGQVNKTTTGLAEFEEYFKDTILHMDHRRLQRQLSGVRKKDPQKRVVFMTFFCLLLLAWNAAFLERDGDWWKFGFVIEFGGLKGKAAIAAVNKQRV